MKWWKTPQASVVWTILRIWLGLQWFEAGIEKIKAGGFAADGFLQGAIANSTGDHPAVQGWYAAFIQHFVLPNVHIFNALIPWGETLVGLGLILGLVTIPAILAGALMNLNYMLAGTTSTNPTLYTVAMILLFTGSGSYYWGLDRLTVPFVKRKFGKGKVSQLGVEK